MIDCVVNSSPPYIGKKMMVFANKYTDCDYYLRTHKTIAGYCAAVFLPSPAPCENRSGSLRVGPDSRSPERSILVKKQTHLIKPPEIRPCLNRIHR